MTPDVRVLVVNYQSGPWLARCLAALVAQTHRAFEAVVLDNGSTDGSFDVAIDDPRIVRVAAGANLGFAAGNNRAAAGARTRWLAMLNPDAIAAPDWLERLLASTDLHPDAKVFGCTQLRADDPATLDGTGDCLSAYGLAWRSGYGHPAPATLPDGGILSACGAAMLIDRVLFESLGGFDEGYFCYVEDVDLCLRARLAGEHVRQCADAVVHHAGGASSEGGHSPFALHLGGRNLVWMLARDLPAPLLPLALLGNAGFTLARVAMPRRADQRRALWRGLRDGWLGVPRALRQRGALHGARRVGWREVAGWLSWNPGDVLARRHVGLRD